MHRTTKIATCCYCGTRAVLTLAGKERHELSCASCGAPLHEMKMLRSEDVRKSSGPAPSRQRQRTPATPQDVWERRKKKTGRKKSKPRKMLKEVFDILEDIFD